MNEVRMGLSTILDSATNNAGLKETILAKSGGDIGAAFSVMWTMINEVSGKGTDKTIALSAVAKIPENIAHIPTDVGTAVAYLEKVIK